MNPISLKPHPKGPSILFSLIGVILLVSAGVFAFSQSGTVNASSTPTFKPQADSYVSQSQANKNFGTNKSLRIDGSPLVYSYLRFSVNGIAGSTVTKVSLRIYTNSSSNAGFSVHTVADNTWQESQITNKNAPTIGKEIATSKGFSGNTWVTVDITPLLISDGTYSIALTSINSTAINLASRENTNYAPELQVEITSTASPTNTLVPTSTKTPTITPTAVSSTQPPTPPSSDDYQPGFPIRAAFFYPWFPESWNQAGYNPFTNYTPSLGFYDSGSTSVIQNQIQAMTYGNINAAILSWWGQGTKSDQRVSTILGATPGSSNPNFRWSIYYENESQGNPAISQIESDLSYFQSHYGANASFLRVNGKFVIFVYADATDGCGMADRWVQADNALGHPAYIVLKVFSGYRTCASQPDSWHQYSPAVATDDQKGYSYAISPGFYKKGETSPRLARDLTAWTTEVKTMVASNDPWQLVTTFNEWGEGTSIESAQEWASSSGFGQYMDVLHANGNGTPPPQPTATATRQASPTSTATPIPTQQPSPTPNPTQPPSGGNDPILFMTSDLVSGGSVDRATLVVNLIQKLMGQHPGTQMLVASAGDNEQENNPTVANYQAYFGTTYGVFVNQGIFMQIRGNHDIQSAGTYTDPNGTVHSSGAAYWTYFGANSHGVNTSGQMLTDYSYNLGTWHIIGLDQLNGSVNTATLNFLKSDLAANTSKTCQLVYWHVPTYSSGAAHGDATGLVPINQAEYASGVDIQVNGHDHDYQRFWPINPSGIRDDSKGITTFIAGIGGEDGRSGSQASIAQAASAMYLDAFPGGAGHAIGVIQFVLHATSADYTLYDANDGSILDHGTVNCH